jgi:hypothetical protein
VPTLEELDTIWAYMNYHLNYARLEHETRPVKLRMQQKYVEHICDAIAPDNAFAMHYSRVLSRKLGRPVSRSRPSACAACCATRTGARDSKISTWRRHEGGVYHQRAKQGQVRRARGAQRARPDLPVPHPAVGPILDRRHLRGDGGGCTKGAPSRAHEFELLRCPIEGKYGMRAANAHTMWLVERAETDMGVPVLGG